MFHQWTETVKRALKEIEKRYPAGSPEERKRLRERFVQIKRACDNLLEAWADIEDRIVRLVHAYPELAEEGEELEGEFELDEMVVRRFRQGQGFYRLNMFVEAEEAFREVVEEEPEFLLGRVYLALSHFQKGNTDEAYRHFQLIASTTNHDVFIAFARHMMGSDPPVPEGPLPPAERGGHLVQSGCLPLPAGRVSRSDSLLLSSPIVG
jgi:tetratricopeptide (TPR) repeat protein